MKKYFVFAETIHGDKVFWDSESRIFRHHVTTGYETFKAAKGVHTRLANRILGRDKIIHTIGAQLANAAQRELMNG